MQQNQEGQFTARKVKLILNRERIKFNYAYSVGGGVFSEECQVTLDYVTFDKNIANISGGAINSETSIIDIHNNVGKGNFARQKGEFALISSESTLKTKFLTLH